MADLFRLVYYSRNRIPGGGAEKAAAVRQILEASRRNNQLAGITGALLFNSGCFGQVLEGPRQAVEARFETIQRDPRHGDVSLLAFAPAQERAFPNWSMAFVGAQTEGRAQFGEIAQASGFDPSCMTADRLFETLERLAMEEEASVV